MTKLPASFWDERYSADDYVYGKVPNDFIRERAGDIPDGRVLCVGGGEGRNAVHLAELGYEVVAVDASREAGRKTQALAAERGVHVETLTVDLATYAIDGGAWSGIVSVFCHLPPALRSHVHRGIVAGLAPGGALLLEAYTPAQLDHRTGGPPVSEMLYTLEILRRELEGLTFEHALELEREVNEGRFHSGRGAVVQLVARKA